MDVEMVRVIKGERVGGIVEEALGLLDREGMEVGEIEGEREERVVRVNVEAEVEVSTGD